MKALFVHAHYDDYEFTAAGTFGLWRRSLGEAFRGRVLIGTDGAAGHQCLTRRETARVRLLEQQASARLGGYEFTRLRYPDGTIPREGCLELNPPLLGALWKAIRDFEPDYLFCPPLPANPLAGIHVDHLVLAEAVRRVAYLVNVPHAFTPEYPANERKSRPCKTPVILSVYDGYLIGANACDFAIEVETVFPEIAAMSWCHRSQICEWLPWVGRHDLEAPASLKEWTGVLHRRFRQRQAALGLRSPRVHEFFTLTGWGATPRFEQLQRDFPPLKFPGRQRARLQRRLRGTVDL